jgi:hypothetical protein
VAVVDNIKNILSVVAISMAVVGYVPYLRDTIKGKTKPHVFSWFVGMTISFIAFGLQIQEKSGAASFVTLSAAIISAVILFFAMKNKDKDITRLDYVCLVFAMVSLVLWLIVKQPILSMLFVVLTEILSVIPAVRKSWKKPYTETLSSFVTNFFRFIIALIALNKYSFVAVGYPTMGILMNGFFAGMLMYRRKVIPEGKQKL